MMHKVIKVYVDDMIAKSRTQGSFDKFEKAIQVPYQVQIETKP